MSVGAGKRLLFGRDLTALPAPLREPNANSPRVLIVGGGVIGLVNAWVLLDHGYHVTVLAKEWASYGQTPRLTSQIAGALWEYPPAVCGQHTDAISLLHSKRWCMIAYHIWDAIAASEPLAKQAGVRMKPADFFFGAPVRDDPQHLAKMQEIMSQGIKGFRHDPAIIEERGIEAKFGAVDAYEHLAPIIDTDVCMKFLEDIAIAKGAKLITRTIKGDLFHQEQALRSEFGADIIINCTGLAGTELAGDRTCYPIRGALIRVINDGMHFPKLEHALTMAADTTNGVNEIVFLVPRNDNILLIGGITEPDIHSLDLTLDSPIIKRMRARCDAFLPGLKNAKLDSDYPLAQGLRPFRQHNVRVERELRSQNGTLGHRRVCSRIIHSYGHGGAGWSLSFGCASDVLALVEEALRETPPTPMRLEFADRARL